MFYFLSFVLFFFEKNNESRRKPAHHSNLRAQWVKYISVKLSVLRVITTWEQFKNVFSRFSLKMGFKHENQVRFSMKIQLFKVQRSLSVSVFLMSLESQITCVEPLIFESPLILTVKL